MYTLNKLAEDGHCYAEREQLIEAGSTLLDVSTDLLSDALNRMIQAEDVMIVQIPDSEDYAIIYVEENLAADLQHEIDRYKDVPSPAIILIPGREGPLGLGRQALVAAVERAVGTNILQ